MSVVQSQLLFSFFGISPVLCISSLELSVCWRYVRCVKFFWLRFCTSHCTRKWTGSTRITNETSLVLPAIDLSLFVFYLCLGIGLIITVIAVGMWKVYSMRRAERRRRSQTMSALSSQVPIIGGDATAAAHAEIVDSSKQGYSVVCMCRYL